MMHYSSAVITIRELPSKKTCREYNHTRMDNRSSSQVLLPFDSEYGIGYKLPAGFRYRLELSIDGVEVTKDLILQGEGTLERFFDSDKRFKFVAANHPSVMDPTSSDNGGVVVKLFMEKRPQIFCGQTWEQQWVRKDIPYTPTPFTYGSNDVQLHDGHLIGNTSLGLGDVQCCSSSSAIVPHSLTRSCSSASFSAPAAASPVRGIGYGDKIPELVPDSLGVTGATVEGRKSNQTFGTTHWNGDETGQPLIFTFQLRGRVADQPAPTFKKAIECPQCKTLNQVSAKFCVECGNKFNV